MTKKKAAKKVLKATKVSFRFSKQWTFTKTIRGTVSAATLEEAEEILDRGENTETLRRRGICVSSRTVDVTEEPVNTAWTCAGTGSWEP